MKIRKIILLLFLLLIITTFSSYRFISIEQGQGEEFTESKSFVLFQPFVDSKYSPMEVNLLLAVLGIAVSALLYAFFLSRKVKACDKGTKKMQDIALAIREGSNSYLRVQFKRIWPLIIIITLVLFFTYTGDTNAFRWGRSLAFLVGASFSFLVGFVGMRLATEGNLRVAAAAMKGYGKAMTIGYRTGTVTGMLTDGLGLLGGTLIFLLYGEQAYEALLGFGFGGTLIALFMRVGGGIYTKAADVGADLVGKIEKDIPEDDPRNAATIADNVGDNVGDCAGMSADIFESYEVTMVAAMILGLATFGHKGVIFPLLVRGIGVVGSMISTYTVRAGVNDSSDKALRSVHRGFWIGSFISIVGFFTLGYFYLHFDTAYLLANPMSVAGFPAGNPDTLPIFFNLGISGLDLRPAFTCLIGVFMAIGLNKVTSYYTHTGHKPVKSLVESCNTGHATNIIQGFAVGYESTVASLVVIAVAIIISVVIYAGTPPLFVAYGIAMTGIGMLTLTGNTISMDVFGPVADNANGIGEMGYNQKEMDETNHGSYKRARQILADLDAVGNTTKAETKGIAIGSAVIAAVSLFASFIAVIAVGSEDKISLMTVIQYTVEAGKLTFADPIVFVGFLIGGAVPFLFSSMLIRAVGRAASYIVKECRMQFRDPDIWEGKKKPDYGRVVNICTNAAQKELIGPGLLAISAPLLVGFLLGPYALGGFLAGMILVGQLLAVFMCNSGGAWDNAKKMIEDEPITENTGKGSDKHKASVTGDTVGDPLKDTAGPAINPLIKVMNMVALLSLIGVLNYNLFTPRIPGSYSIALFVIIAAISAIGWAVWRSKKENGN